MKAWITPVLVLASALPLKASGISPAIPVESDACPAVTVLEISTDGNRLIAMDSVNGPQVQILDGEHVRRSIVCGKLGVVVTEKNIHIYSASKAKWLRKSDWLNGASTSDSYKIAVGPEMVLLANFTQVFFYDASADAVHALSLNADQPRGAVVASDYACLVTDRRIYCHSTKHPGILVYPLYNREVRSAKAMQGKAAFTAHDQIIFYLPARNKFETLAVR